jgi:hypothetical protein
MFVTIFVTSSPCRTSFDIGSGLGNNEFGDVKSEGLYDFVYSFNDLNYRGSVRVGILLGRN